ncbi:MAG: right-handed parallel beta-helix repeat-containing protein [Phycisphaerales bacterium]
MVLVLGAWLYAGPLNPPSGPIASTGKTLTEVEPRLAINSVNTPGDANSVYRISQPGSYYLTSDVIGVNGKHGIEIAADGVTIDLMGLAVRGSAQTADGITTDGLHGNIVIKNGFVGGWGNQGINLIPTGVGEGHHVEDVIVSGTVASGIRVGSASIVRSCQVINVLNATSGALVVGDESIVEKCVVRNNSGGSLTVGNGCSVESCVVSFNSSGVFAQSSCTFRNCIARSNSGRGFFAQANSIFVDCSAILNQFGGFEIGDNSVLDSCVASDNVRDGFSGGGACTFTSCTASGSTFSGFVAALGTRVDSCIAENNGSYGINVGGSSVSRCTVRSNSLDGIRATSNSVIEFNNCSANGTGSTSGAGVRITGTDCRVTNNTATNNDIGISVEASVNLITGNACRGNPLNYQIVANNRVGIIVTPLLSGAISGNGPGAGIGSTDPWANFAY